MNGSESERRESFITRRWQEGRLTATDEQHHHHDHRSPSFYTTALIGATTTSSLPIMLSPDYSNLRSFPGGLDDELVSTLVPPVTVVLEGRSICQRISLHMHASYQSLAKALRLMFSDGGDHSITRSTDNSAEGLDLSNAVPGHLIAYEDMENDLLLVGDLNWKDFVRVAKRIRILPVKATSRKGGEAGRVAA